MDGVKLRTIAAGDDRGERQSFAGRLGEIRQK